MNKLLKSLIILILFSIPLSNIALAKIEKINQQEAEILFEKDNKDKKEKLPFYDYQAVKLQDGNFLVLKSSELFSERWYSQIEFVIKEKLRKEFIEQNYKIPQSNIKTSSGKVLEHKNNTYTHMNLLSTKEEKRKFDNYFYNYKKRYIILSEEEKAKIYLPLLKEHADGYYYQKYLDYIKVQKEYENAQIYNTKTKELKTVGKRNIQGKIYKKALLDDGRVLVIYNNPHFHGHPPIPNDRKLEIYSPETEKFKRLKDLKNTNIIHIFGNGKILANITDEKDYRKIKKTAIYDINSQSYTDLNLTINHPYYKKIELSDGRILIFDVDSDKSKFIYFNPKDNTLVQSKNTFCFHCFEFFRAENDIIYLISSMDINKLDAKNDTYEKIGEIKIPRRDCKMELINNSLFIYNGENLNRCYFDGSCEPENRIEIFNVKTRKTTIKRKLGSQYNWDVKPIDDKKVLLYIHESNESFIYTED